jgi:hypothetical protein
MMNKIREFFFPVVVLGSWVVVAAYTLSSLGETPARVQTAMAAQHAPAVEVSVSVAARQASLTPKAHKKMSRRGPRA